LKRLAVVFLASLGIALAVLPTLKNAAARPSDTSARVDFNRDVRPILSDNCFACHGPDEQARMVELRVDTREGMFADRGGYSVIVPGNAEESILYQRISSDMDEVRMPPPASGRTLTPQQIELIRRWIDEGAEWRGHWAFVPPRTPAVPEVLHKRWPRNPIDHFVLARLKREGLEPSPEADRVTLLRRVTLDLTGLPPTPAEVDAFLAAASPDAYEKKVDELLASPHYGERLALFWLDLARYADTHGYHIDSHRDMWPWRDWVISAFNRNLPFDRFTIEQLAGDLMPEATQEQKIATGFNRNHVINYEGGAIPEEYQVEYVVDRVETTSTVWMGLTMGCARCHDHKYDPVKQKDFYRFFAFFNNVPEKGLDGQTGNAAPVLALPTHEQKRQRGELDARISALQAALPEAEVVARQDEWQRNALETIPEAPREGLAAHYEFEAENDLRDATGQGRDGRILRGGVPVDYGVIGRAGEFSGETHVELGDEALLDLSRPFAVATWFSPGQRFEMTMLQKLDGPENRRGFEIAFDEAVWVGEQKRASHLFVRLIHRWPEEAIEIRTKGREAHSFRHLALNFDGSGRAAGLKLYLDGKLADVEVLKDNLHGSAANDQPVSIGDKRLGRPWKGRLDDLRFYRRPLTEAEIAQLYAHQPARGLLSGLTGACAEAARIEKGEKPPENPEDPLPEQAVQDTVETRIKRQCKGERDKLRDYFLTRAAPENLRRAHAELKELRKQKAELEKKILTTMVMAEMKQPRRTHVLVRGDYRHKGELVEPGVPSVLPPLPAGAPRNRLGLARWLVDPAHPLTARVTVNRFWQMLFGTGLVKTSEDFGAQGEPPSHPELLDWLATEFVRTGWDVKAMLKLVVTSATYRQSSRVTAELLDRDPENRWLARGPRFRLPAELVRDNALAASGLLDRRIGGPSVFPYQPAGLWEEMAFGEGFSAQEYTPSKGPDLYRRSLYTFWKRTVPPPSLATFDAPDREKCTARRAVTNTPLQALVLMNDPTYVEAARALAQRTLREAPRALEARLAHAFRLATARPPSSEEARLLRGLAEEQLAHYRRHRDSALELLRVGDSDFDASLDPQELAAWTTVASAILNLDEAMTKE
jgi:mono/diheme cytochrome c family protein